MSTPFIHEIHHEKKLRIGFIILVFGILTAIWWRFDRWPREAEGGDPGGYYLHLPSLWLFQDVGDYHQSMAGYTRYFPRSAGRDMVEAFTLPTPSGKRAIKYPLGLSLLMSPFFVAGHAVALCSEGRFAADGWSLPYFFAVGLSPIFYACLGFWLLFGILRRYFSFWVTVLTLFTLSFATNLYYFMVYNNLMAHAFLFALYAWLLKSTIQFWEKPGVLRAIWVGLSVGLIAATRLHEVLCFVFPLLYGVVSLNGIRQRMAFFAQNIRLLWVAAGSVVICLVPQALYYKTVSGQFFWYPYIGETFNFNHPRIWDGLFHYSNGWLIYTPVMILALLGLIWLPRWVPGARLALMVFSAIFLYVTYSWWCWNYINGHGSRPMIETYPLLALPLSAFFSTFFRRGWGLLTLLVAFFAWLNMLQCWQIENGLLWPEGENRAHFWSAFGRTQPDQRSFVTWESQEYQPDEQNLYKIRTLAENNFEDSLMTAFVSDLQHSGRFSLRMHESDSFPLCQIAIPEDLKAGDWLKISIWGFVRNNEQTWSQEDRMRLVAGIPWRQGRHLRFRQREIQISTHFDNTEYHIWSNGKSQVWGEAAFFIKIPKGVDATRKIRVFLHNPRRQRITVDDLTVSWWRSK